MEILKKLSAAWKWFADDVGIALNYIVRETNPRHAVAVYIVANIFITIITFFATVSWPDFFTVAGYWVTFTGLLVAFVELYRTRTAASQIGEAVLQENTWQRGYHYRHSLERAKSALISSRQSVVAKQWPMAVARLEDLTDSLSYINSISPTADNVWTQHVASVQEWIAQFGAGQAGKKLAYDNSAWRTVVLAILSQLDDELAPFQYGEVDENAIE